ncbi:MAG: hypothetical protein ABI380_02570 [Edaphobacter sp.]
MLKRLRESPLSKVAETKDASFRVAVPKSPFRSLDLGQRVRTTTTVVQVADTLGYLLQLLKSHPDVKPIEHMLGTGRDAALHRAEVCGTIGKNRDGGALTYSRASHRQPGRLFSRGVGTLFSISDLCILGNFPLQPLKASRMKA